jgi:hypothetical protein
MSQIYLGQPLSRRFVVQREESGIEAMEIEFSPKSDRIYFGPLISYAVYDG